ncbi:hypothetical protein KP004_06360 [Geomonas oryzisoli]|uniref:Uncharacterized protein n=1 Tax=Geomonas oryzisoli TaxID=2847992 RepID=A0ABX8JDL5_9BACT|nr:hypothetical protein [Geomonas oryzisoli]QWV94797.1 hypothetical protein KP004_06360 [Geomonas oryzisoli]
MAPSVKAVPLIIRNSPQNPTPLGLEVGYATRRGFTQKYPSATVFQAVPNTVTGGVNLQVEPGVFGIDGVQDVALSFDRYDVLTGVVLVMESIPKATLMSSLHQFKLVQDNIDPSGDVGNALFQKGDCEIRVELEPVSKSVVVIYGTKSFLEKNDQAMQVMAQNSQ